MLTFDEYTGALTRAAGLAGLLLVSVGWPLLLIGVLLGRPSESGMEARR